MVTDEKRAANRAYYLANKAKVIARAVAWRKNNPEKVRVIMRRHRRKYLARHRAYFQKWWDKINQEPYRERHRERSREWRKFNKAKMRFYKAQRRATKRQIGACDRASRNMLCQIISDMPRLKCGICGNNMQKDDRSVDHIIPLSKGGSDEIWNLRVVHIKCNLKKQAQMPHALTGQFEINFAGDGAHPKKTLEEGHCSGEVPNRYSQSAATNNK